METRGGLELAESTAGTSPLAAASPVNMFDQAINGLRESSVGLPIDAIDSFAIRVPVLAGGDFPKWAEMKAEMEAAMRKKQQAQEASLAELQHPPINRNLPWLRFAAGMMSPTHTGAFGESVGYGIKGLAGGMEDVNKQELDFARRAAEARAAYAKGDVSDVMDKYKLGLGAEQIEATLKLLNARMGSLRYKNVPLVGMVDTMSLDENGRPRLVRPAPEFQTAMSRMEPTWQREADQRNFKTPAERTAYINAQRNAFQSRWFDEHDPTGYGPSMREQGSQPLPGQQVPGGAAAPAPGVDPGQQARPPVPAPLGGVPPAPESGTPGTELLNPENKEYFTQLGKSRSEYEEKLQGAAEAGVASNRQLAMIEDAIHHGKPGAGAALWAAIAKLRMQMGIGTERDVEIAKNFEEADKLSGGLVSNYLKTVSQRPSQMEFLLAQTKFVPNMNMTEQGAANVIAAMRQANNLPAEEQRAYYAWRKKNPTGSFREFTTDWLDQVSKMPLKTDQTFNGGPLPAGVPEGSKFIGYAKGTKDKVYQTPDNKKLRVKE